MCRREARAIDEFISSERGLKILRIKFLIKIK